MLPSFGKDRVIEDIRVTKGQLDELVEIYGEASDLLHRTKFNNPTVLGMFEQFKRVAGGGSDNMIVYIDKNLKQVQVNLNAAESLAKALLNNTIASRGLSYKQATVIQFVNSINFVNNFARSLLHYIYVLESTQYSADPQDALTAISKPDLIWLEEKFLDFCNAFKTVSMKTEDVLKKFDEIPEAVVNEASERTLTSTLGAAKMDPLKLGFAGNWMNPIYFFRMQIAEWQVKRYNLAKETLAVLRLRRIQLEDQRNGKENAKLEKEIQYFESRIQTLSYEISEVEKKYG